MTASIVVVNDPEEGQAGVPKNRQARVLALMPDGGRVDWPCGVGCYGFVPKNAGRAIETPTVWVINTDCAEHLGQIPREIVREVLYR